MRLNYNQIMIRTIYLLLGVFLVLTLLAQTPHNSAENKQQSKQDEQQKYGKHEINVGNNRGGKIYQKMHVEQINLGRLLEQNSQSEDQEENQNNYGIDEGQSEDNQGVSDNNGESENSQTTDSENGEEGENQDSSYSQEESGENSGVTDNEIGENENSLISGNDGESEDSQGVSDNDGESEDSQGVDNSQQNSQDQGECSSATSQSLCNLCHDFYFDSYRNSCVACPYKLEGCEGCNESRQSLCRYGCPNYFTSNGTYCYAKQLISIKLTLNPSKLIKNWVETDLTNQKANLNANRQVIKQAVLSLMGLSAKPQMVKSITLSVGSIIAVVTLFPDPKESMTVTESNIKNSMIKNQQVSGLSVLQSSLENESESEASSSAPVGMIVGIIIGVIFLIILIVVIIILIKKIRSKSLGGEPTPLTKTESIRDMPGQQWTDKEYDLYSDAKKTDPEFVINPDR